MSSLDTINCRLSSSARPTLAVPDKCQIELALHQCINRPAADTRRFLINKQAHVVENIFRCVCAIVALFIVQFFKRVPPMT